MNSIPIKNTAVSTHTPFVFEAQNVINTILSSANVHGSCSDVSTDVPVENVYNHINLDQSDGSVQSDDLISARIYPYRSPRSITSAQNPITVDTEKIKKQVTQFSIVLVSHSKKILKVSLRAVIKLDLYCEQMFTGIQDFISETTIAFKKSMLEKKSKIALEEVVAVSVIPDKVQTRSTTLSVVQYSPLDYSVVPVTYHKIRKYYPDTLTTNTEAKKESVLGQVFSILYAELRHGRGLRSIDSI